MKKIIALVVSLILLIITIYSRVDDLNTSVDVINAVKPATTGDYQQATTNVVNVGTNYAIGAAYFAIFMAVVTAIIAVLKKI
jgi:hypothetical protein